MFLWSQSSFHFEIKRANPTEQQRVNYWTRKFRKNPRQTATWHRTKDRNQLATVSTVDENVDDSTNQNNRDEASCWLEKINESATSEILHWQHTWFDDLMHLFTRFQQQWQRHRRRYIKWIDRTRQNAPDYSSTTNFIPSNYSDSNDR